MRKCTKKWARSDGTKVRICDMSYAELSSTINMVRRIATSLHSNMIAVVSEGIPLTVDKQAKRDMKRRLAILKNDGPIPSMICPLYGNLMWEKYCRITR